MWIPERFKKKKVQSEALPRMLKPEEVLNMSEADIVAYVNTLDDKALVELHFYAEQVTTEETRSKGGVFSTKAKRSLDLHTATTLALRKKGFAL
jgi:hypothetical protein